MSSINEVEKRSKRLDENLQVSHELVQSCLREVVRLYKISALIELFIFILIHGLFFTFYVAEDNVHQIWTRNEKFRHVLFNTREAQRAANDLDDLEYNQRLLKFINRSFDFSYLNKIVYDDAKSKETLVCKNIYFNLKLGKKVKCTKTNFDYYFTNVAERVGCFSTLSDGGDNFHEIDYVFDLVGNTTSVNTSAVMIEHLEQLIRSRPVRLATVKLFIMRKYLTKIEIQMAQSASGKLTFNSRIHSLKLNRLVFYKVMCIMLAFYAIYYGYEKVREIGQGELISSQRLLTNMLDFFSIYLALMTIIYLFDLEYYFDVDAIRRAYTCKRSLPNDTSRWLNPNDMQHEQLLSELVACYRSFYEYFSVFYIVSLSRMFKYSIVYRPLEILVKSLKTIFYNVFQFSLLFLAIYFGFALFGMSVFGSSMLEYASFYKACLTLTVIVFGQLNFDSYYEFDSFLGTSYCCLYVVMIVIVSFNIMYAVITESYVSIKSYLSTESQLLNVVPDCYFIKRNFNFLVKLKLPHYDSQIRDILEGMVILKSTNRLLTSVEVEYDLNSLDYDPDVLKEVLKKYGLSAPNYKWKKNTMDAFRADIEKERAQLADLFSVHLQANRELFESKCRHELARHLFVIRERYVNFDFKIRRLNSLLSILSTKTHRFIDFLTLYNKPNPTFVH